MAFTEMNVAMETELRRYGHHLYACSFRSQSLSLFPSNRYPLALGPTSDEPVWLHEQAIEKV